MHDSKFLLEGSLTDRALVLCVVTSLHGLAELRHDSHWLVTLLCSCYCPDKTKQFSCDRSD